MFLDFPSKKKLVHVGRTHQHYYRLGKKLFTCGPVVFFLSKTIFKILAKYIFLY